MAIECNSKPNRREIWISFGPTLWSPMWTANISHPITIISLYYYQSRDTGINLTRSITIVSKSTHSLGKLAYFLFFNNISSFFQFPNFVFTSSLSTLFYFIFQLANFVFLIVQHFSIFQFCISSPSSSSILLVVPSCPDVHVRNFHPHTLKCFFFSLHFGKNSGVFRGWHEFGNEKIIIISIR